MNEIIKIMLKSFSKEQKLSFKSSFVVGIIVHLFMLSNKIPNHDDVRQLYDSMNRFRSGRWFLFFPSQISSDLSLPWLDGILGIIYISFSVMIIVELFQVKTNICIVAISAIMVTFPTIASTFTYMQVGDSYFFALLLTCIAIRCLISGFSKIHPLVAIVLLTLSMGIYQAYLPFAVALLVIWHIKELLIEDEEIRRIFLSGIMCICAIGGSVLAYIVITKLILTYQNAEIYGHIAGFVLEDLSVKNMLKLVFVAYKKSLGFWLVNESGIHYEYLGYLYMLVFMIAIIFSFLLYKKYNHKKNRIKTFLLVFLYAILPLASGLIYCMCARVHLLMIYGFVVPVLLAIFLTDWVEQSNIAIESVKGKLIHLGQVTTVLIILVTSFNYALVSNQAYLSLYLTYEQSYAYANRLVTEIQMQNGYRKDKAIVLIGEPIVNVEYTMPWREEKSVQAMHGVSASLISAYTLPLYLKYYIGVEQEVVSISSPDQLSDLKMDTDINALSCYPDAGSMICEDDMVFVKFNNVQ